MFKNRTRSIHLFNLLIICILLVTIMGIPKPASAIVSKFASTWGTEVDDCTAADPCSLQHAVDTATDGMTIYAGPGFYYPDALPSDQVLLLNKSVNIYGGWDGVSSSPVITDHHTYPSYINGQNARQGVTAVFYSGSGLLYGFHIINGNATGKYALCSASSPAGCGGGIFISGVSLTVEHCFIEDNVAATTTDASARTGYGGGIYIQSPKGVVIRNNIIRSNDASTATSGPAGDNGEGGGIFVSGAVDTTDLTIAQNEISENSAAATAYVGWGDGLTILDSHGVISQNTF